MTARPDGLAALADVELSPRRRESLDLALASNGGPAFWRARKAAETQAVLALAEVAGPRRMDVLTIDLQADLRAVVRLRAPVALRPGPDERLRLADTAVLGIVYPRVILAAPLPGYAAVSLLFPPGGAWYPNVSTSRGQQLCLGPCLPPGIPVTELVLLAWGLLTMQSVQLDPADVAGVFNLEAARWWQDRLDRIPLSREPFLTPETEP